MADELGALTHQSAHEGDFVVLVVPGDHRPTLSEITAADIVLKVTPPSARVQLLGSPGIDHAKVKIRRWRDA
jgi:hypothetical protein